MRFKIDENLPAELVSRFQMAGHDAISVLGQKLGGAPDKLIADVCRSENRAFITLDLDFADIRKFATQGHPGLIVLRLGSQAKTHVVDVIVRLLPLIAVEPVAGRLWIVEENAVRIRGNQSP